MLTMCSFLVQNGPRGRREREFYELISRLVALDRTAALDSQQGHRDFGQVAFPFMFFWKQVMQVSAVLLQHRVC